MEKQELLNVIALTMVPKVGPVLAKNLIAYCGSAGNVLKERKGHLLKIPGIGEKTASAIKSAEKLKEAEKELEFIEKNNIQALYFLNDDYPVRMRDVNDAPVIIYYKGNVSLNAPRVLGVVGTRKATEYGKSICEKLIEDLAPYNVIIISGLAYGIDYVAHKAAVGNSMATIGVLGHGLDIVYPSAHKNLAEKMLLNGGLLSEFVSGTQPDKVNFPARNRIVAGLIDGLVLVETSIKGGALITAEISNSYNRDVCAFPGRTTDEYSAGCNNFIKTNKACLVESAADVAYQMGWESTFTNKPSKLLQYDNLDKDEKKVVEILRLKDRTDFDTLVQQSGMNFSDLSMLLLNLEFKGIVQALPGKFYRLH